MRRSNRSLLVAVLLLVLTTVFLFVAGPSRVLAALSTPYDELRMFTDVFALVRRSYVEEVDSRRLIYGGIRGMLETLDPHSGFLTPEAYLAVQEDTRGEFGGIGIELSRRGEELVVVAPIEDTPAFRAGVQAGDRVISVDGEAITGLDTQDVVNRLRGDAGSEVVLGLRRGDDATPIQLRLVRERIRLESVKARLLAPGFGYVRLVQFQEQSDSELQRALAKLHEDSDAPLSGLILDLRNNPGGLLDQAVKVADLFLERGVIVYTEGRDADSRMKFMAHQDGTEPGYPLVVLVNGGTASAAEIVAGALKDHRRALLLGTRTFGKGSVQTVLPLADGSGVRLTTALYFTPAGTSIQALGILPDIEAPAAVVTRSAEPESEREQNLENHFSGPHPPEEASAGEADSRDDYQLQRALDLLKGWQLFNRPASAA